MHGRIATRWIVAVTAFLGSATGILAQEAPEQEPPGPIISLPGHTGAVMCIAISPNGRLAATHGGLGDHAFHLWDLVKRKQLGKRDHDECAGLAIVWTSNGRSILTGGDGGRGGGSVLLQDPTTGKRVGKLITHDRWVKSVALTADGKRFVAADGLGFVRIRDFKTGEKVCEFEHGTGVNSVAFSPDGKLLLTGCDDKSVRLWNVEKDRQERLLEGHTATVGSVAFSRDGRQALSASFSTGGDSDGTIRVWDVASGKKLAQFEVGGEGHVLMSATFSADGRRALTGHANGEVRLWDVGTRKKLATYKKHKHPVSSVAFSPDGRYALSGEDCQGGSAMWLYRLP